MPSCTWLWPCMTPTYWSLVNVAYYCQHLPALGDDPSATQLPGRTWTFPEDSEDPAAGGKDRWDACPNCFDQWSPVDPQCLVNDTRQIHILRVQRATSQNASYHGELQQKVCHVMRAIVFAIVSNRSQMIPNDSNCSSTGLTMRWKKLIEKTNYIIKHLRCFMTQVENVHWKFIYI